MTGLRRTIAAPIAALAIAACAVPIASCAQPKPAPGTSRTPAATAPAQVASAAPRIDIELRWVLDTVKAGGKITEADIAAHFDSSFLAEVPAAQLATVMAQLGGTLPPIELTATETPAERRRLARIRTASGPLKVFISLDAKSEKIDGLLFQPDIDTAEIASLETLGREVTALAPSASFLAAEVVDGACKPIQETAADQELAIGSAFKLYILIALADRIAAGKLTWDGELAIDDRLKSLPSGTMQNEPNGARFSVRHFATQMISISDNTATDHLLHAVGRKAAEAAVASSGHTAPARNVPFLSTRELFLLKLALSDEERKTYLDSKPAKRRAYLDRILARRSLTDAGGIEWSAPRQIESLEWFASPNDLCRAMAALIARTGSDAGKPILDVLSKNPGLPIDAAKWPFIGFKGGSEPGVMNLSWILRRDDGRWFFASFGFNDPARALDESKILRVAGSVFALLRDHDR